MYSIKTNPDIYLSFSSPNVGHIAMLMNKPHIVFDDTEHATLEHIMYKPFASKIVTPKSFLKNLGKKHFKFNSIFCFKWVFFNSVRCANNKLFGY